MIPRFLTENDVHTTEGLFAYLTLQIQENSNLPNSLQEKLLNYLLELINPKLDLINSIDLPTLYEHAANTIAELKSAIEDMSTELIETNYPRSDQLFRQVVDFSCKV